MQTGLVERCLCNEVESALHSLQCAQASAVKACVLVFSALPAQGEGGAARQADRAAEDTGPAGRGRSGAVQEAGGAQLREGVL